MNPDAALSIENITWTVGQSREVFCGDVLGEVGADVLQFCLVTHVVLYTTCVTRQKNENSKQGKMHGLRLNAI